MLKKEKYNIFISRSYKQGLYFRLILAFLAFVLPALLPTVASAAGNYNITFDANGGTGGGVASVADTTDAIPSALPVSNAGHTLLGFATTPNGTPVTTYIVSGQDFTLYAIWSLNSYLISFDTQGGGANTSVSITYYTDAITHAPQVSKSNYNFLGWSATPGGQVTSSYAALAPATLYAIYSLITPPVVIPPVVIPPVVIPPVVIPPVITSVIYKITFDTNGGTIDNIISSLIEGSDALKFAPVLSFKGYTFSGWSLKVNGPKINTYIVSNDSVLHALWSPDSYKVNFDPNGGDGGVQTFSVIYLKDAMALVPEGVSRNGYSLVGWSDSKDGSSLNHYVTTTDTTLYAIWKIKTYTISFNGNVGSQGKAPDSVDYTLVQGPFMLPSPLILEKPNSVFSGWSESRTGGILYSPYIPTRDVTIYAIWVPISKNNTVIIPSGKETTVALDSSYGTLDSIISFGLGFDKVTLNGSNVTYSVPVSSSGLTSIKLLVKNNDKQKIIEIPVMILSSGPVNFNISLLNLSSSTVSWYSYNKTSSYSLYVDGKNVCNTTKLSCKINKVIGPNTKAYMLTHVKGQPDIKSPVLYQMRAPLPVSKVNFTNGSLAFKMVGKNELANLAQTVNNNGFTQVLILGKMSRFQGRAVYDKFKTLMPKANILVMDYAPNTISDKDKPLKEDLLATTVTVSIS